MNEFRREETPHARKDHTCDLCNGKIAKGNEYIHSVCFEDGYCFNNHYHRYCYDLIERYCRSLDEGDCYDEWNVLCDIRERVCESCCYKDNCEFGFEKSPQCVHVNAKYRKEK